MTERRLAAGLPAGRNAVSRGGYRVLRALAAGDHRHHQILAMHDARQRHSGNVKENEDQCQICQDLMEFSGRALRVISCCMSGIASPLTFSRRGFADRLMRPRRHRFAGVERRQWPSLLVGPVDDNAADDRCGEDHLRPGCGRGNAWRETE